MNKILKCTLFSILLIFLIGTTVLAQDGLNLIESSKECNEINSEAVNIEDVLFTGEVAFPDYNIRATVYLTGTMFFNANDGWVFITNPDYGIKNLNYETGLVSQKIIRGGYGYSFATVEFTFINTSTRQTWTTRYTAGR